MVVACRLRKRLDDEFVEYSTHPPNPSATPLSTAAALMLSWSYGWRLWCAALPCEAAARKHRGHLLSVHAHPFRWLITNTAVLLCPLSKHFPQAMNRFGLFPSDGLCARGRWGQRCEP